MSDSQLAIEALRETYQRDSRWQAVRELVEQERGVLGCKQPLCDDKRCAAERSE